MSKSNIYETNWTDLVFENKNKEYGAYQLRQENAKTTVTALFIGLLLLASLGTASMLISKLETQGAVETDPILEEPIVVTQFDNNPVVPKTPETIAPPQQTAPAAPATDLSQLSHPVIVTPDQAVDNIATNIENTPVVDNATTGTGTVTNTLPTTGGNGSGTEIAPTTNDPVNSAVLDKMPEFPGGMAKFYTYVGNNFHKPELDAEKTLRVYVSFVIERDGSITDITVINDPGYGLGKEAIRVLKSIKTKWVPGILNGKTVRTAYNLPITIKTEVE
ncbi:outer membrane transport energization protein TonB [Flavobacterium aquidurense]|uniref:Energy transducer TonB n=1 Tax=Flavobacterium frigidimaris TaxID=262320 RepID=A0ABX4BU59_FLAFR|nr:energy transducer TonB [Flavobacterium frigidimaris]OXA80789.1 energy transducer TonB [Flavobacterium frigidimaris]SDZ07089.1 outer membrane transport energization protein TonB [Flavobacterium aquidurense]